MQTSASYYDGQTSAARTVTISFNDDGSISLDTGEGSKLYTLDELQFSSRLGDTPRTLTFPDGSSCHIQDNDIVDEHLRQFRKNRAAAFIHLLESHMLFVASAVVFTIAFSWAMIAYVIPASARTIAFELPPEVNQHLGRGTLETLDSIAFQPSSLAQSDKKRLSDRFNAMLETIAGTDGYQLLFRSSEKLGANAFALPSGIIVVTDKLVEISDNDEEIVAILAHEIGHLHHRHALRMTMQSSAVALLITVITGDPFSSSSLLVALPTILLNNSYSRDFEIEADDYAYEYMKQNDIALSHFGDILERITAEHGSSDIDDYISTHPSTELRLQRFR